MSTTARRLADPVLDVSRRAAGALRDWSAQRWQEFRRQPKYFRYRAYIIATYLGIVLVTIVSVIPTGPSNRIKAYVLAARGDFVVGSYVMVRNDSKRDWSDITITINDSHTFSAPALAKGDRLTVRLKQLEGPAPLKEEEVSKVHVKCSQGEETYEVRFP